MLFTEGTTESINLVAHSFGRAFVKIGDAVVISALEHHSNIVHWQIICEQVGAELRVIPMTNSGDLHMEKYKSLLDERVKIVSVNYVSSDLCIVNQVL